MTEREREKHTLWIHIVVYNFYSLLKKGNLCALLAFSFTIASRIKIEKKNKNVKKKKKSSCNMVDVHEINVFEIFLCT